MESRNPISLLKRRVLSGLSRRTGASAFRRNFVSVAKANVLAQLMLLATMPLLAHLYTPEAFGLAALFMAALQIVGTVASLQYERTLPNSRSERGAAARFVAGVTMLLVTILLLSVILIWQPAALRAWRGAGELGTLLWWLPVAVGAHGLQLLTSAWFVREGDLTLISRARIVQSIGYIVAAFAGVLLVLPDAGLVIATCAAWIASFATLLPGTAALRRSVRRLTRTRFIRLIRLTARESAGIAGVSLLNIVSLVAPVALLAQVYSATEIGYYSLMMRMVATPLTVITAALAVSFWSRSAELVRERRYRALRATFVRTTLYLLVPAGLVIAFCLIAPPFVPKVLGAEWAGAGPVLVASAPMLAGLAVFSPTNHLIVLGCQRYQLIADGARLTLMVLTVIVAERQGLPFHWAVAGVSVSSLIGHVTLFSIQLLVHRRYVTP